MAKLKEIIGEELFKQLPVEKQKELEKQDLEDVSDGKYVDKSRFNQVNEQVKEYKKQVGERDKQISDLKEEYKDVDGLKEKVTKLEADNKTQKETYEAKLNDITFNNVLEKALSGYKVKNTKLVMALLDKEKLKVDGEDIIGFKDQMESIKKENEFLFEKDVAGTGSFNTGDSGGEGSGRKESFGTLLGKQKAEQAKIKGITDFIK